MGFQKNTNKLYFRLGEYEKSEKDETKFFNQITTTIEEYKQSK